MPYYIKAGVVLTSLSAGDVVCCKGSDDEKIPRGHAAAAARRRRPINRARAAGDVYTARGRPVPQRSDDPPVDLENHFQRSLRIP